MEADHTLFDEFARLMEHYFGQETTVEARLSRKRETIVLEIPKMSQTGFDIAATVQTYGIYPRAGEWVGAPWEPLKDWVTEELCKDFFGFIRMLLCTDAQLHYVYRHDRLYKTAILLKSLDGWQVFEDTKFLIIPFGDIREEILVNDHLPSRYPYDNLETTNFGVYRW